MQGWRGAGWALWLCAAVSSGQASEHAQSPLVQPPDGRVSANTSTVDALGNFDAAAELIRQRAYHADRVDWTQLPKLREGLAGAPAGDSYPAIRKLIAQLDDHHSGLTPARQADAYRTSLRAQAPPMVFALQDGYGYIALPGLAGMNQEASERFAESVAAAIEKNAPRVRCGWIVDLRANGGGNMHPMLASLHDLLGDGDVGAIVGRKHRYPLRVEAGAGRLDLTSAPVAVLQGPRTASSGEIVAIAFRGRPRSASIGQPSAGLTSANVTPTLPDGAILRITGAYDADRTGRLYAGPLPPDILVPAVDGIEASVERALQWLAQESRCELPAQAG